MNNRVVLAITRTYQQHNYTTMRFNFRGVGASRGSFDAARAPGDHHDFTLKPLSATTPPPVAHGTAPCTLPAVLSGSCRRVNMKAAVKPAMICQMPHQATRMAMPPSPPKKLNTSTSPRPEF